MRGRFQTVLLWPFLLFPGFPDDIEEQTVEYVADQMSQKKDDMDREAGTGYVLEDNEAHDCGSGDEEQTGRKCRGACKALQAVCSERYQRRDI